MPLVLKVRNVAVTGASPTPRQDTTQDQVYIRALAVDFFTHLLITVEAWAERTIAEVEMWDDVLATDDKNERGLEKICRLPVRTPDEALRHISRPPAEYEAVLAAKQGL